MHTIRTSFAKFFVVVALMGVLAPVAPVAVPRAHAQVAAVVTVVANTDVLQSMLNGIGWVVAKTIIQSIAQSTIRWINSGFQGSPGFVTNLRDHLQNLADAEANNFLNQLSVNVNLGVNGSVASPYISTISDTLRDAYFRSTSPQAYALLNGYTLPQTCPNYQGFLAGQNFSLNCWVSAWSHSANNPFGAYRSAEDALLSRVSVSVGDRQTELNWAHGILSFRGGCSQPSGSTASLSKQDNCSHSLITLPGTWVENQFEQVLGTGIRQLELADTINEVVAALVVQMTNQLISSTGLLGASSPSAGGGPSYTTQLGNANANGGYSVTFSARVQTEQIRTQTYHDNWQSVLTLATQTRASCNAASIIGIAEVQSILDTATANVARGTRALTTLADIIAKVQQAQSADTTTAASLSAQATQEHDTLISSGDLPEDNDLQDSLLQSHSGDGTDYDKLTKFRSNGCVL